GGARPGGTGRCPAPPGPPHSSPLSASSPPAARPPPNRQRSLMSPLPGSPTATRRSASLRLDHGPLRIERRFPAVLLRQHLPQIGDVGFGRGWLGPREALRVRGVFLPTHHHPAP